MKKNISTLMRAWISDNKEYIANYETIADYFIEDLQNRENSIYDYFNDDDIEDEAECKEEVKEFLLKNYNYKLDKEYDA